MITAEDAKAALLAWYDKTDYIGSSEGFAEDVITWLAAQGFIIMAKAKRTEDDSDSARAF